MQRKMGSDIGIQDLLGFGFVSFKTLEGAQTAKYQA
jgi:hypothetical protein